MKSSSKRHHITGTMVSPLPNSPRLAELLGPPSFELWRHVGETVRRKPRMDCQGIVQLVVRVLLAMP